MSPLSQRVGGILSADIAVPEHEREMRFYSRVLTTGENRLWREDLMNNRGMPIIGLGARSAEYADLPLQWMPHIQVADVAASVERALDLTVSDASATRDFYRQVVDWSVQNVEMEDASGRYADYNMLGADGKPAAGVCHARGVNLGLPPVWMVYLPVGDFDESLRRVREGGGKIIKATRETDGEYAYAVVQDPVGACVALVPG